MFHCNTPFCIHRRYPNHKTCQGVDDASQNPKAYPWTQGWGWGSNPHEMKLGILVSWWGFQPWDHGINLGFQNRRKLRHEPVGISPQKTGKSTYAFHSKVQVLQASGEARFKAQWEQTNCGAFWSSLSSLLWCLLCWKMVIIIILLPFSSVFSSYYYHITTIFISIKEDFLMMLIGLATL